MAKLLPDTMKCPHCLVSFHIPDRSHRGRQIGFAVTGYWWEFTVTCPTCNDVIVWLVTSETFVGVNAASMAPYGEMQIRMVYPQASGRPPVPAEVPTEFAEDYKEACLVFSDSPKASAALSRRCLQHILREKAEITNHTDLAKAINEVVNDPAVPTDISSALDAVRNIGNFSAHPNKSLNTGEIVPVEPGEAEWCLEVIEVLFDYYFVRPADIQRRTVALNQKLAETGKPQMPV